MCLALLYPPEARGCSAAYHPAIATLVIVRAMPQTLYNEDGRKTTRSQRKQQGEMFNTAHGEFVRRTQWCDAGRMWDSAAEG
jgi:hypothetical protein